MGTGDRDVPNPCPHSCPGGMGGPEMPSLGIGQSLERPRRSVEFVRVLESWVWAGQGQRQPGDTGDRVEGGMGQPWDRVVREEVQ